MNYVFSRIRQRQKKMFDKTLVQYLTQVIDDWNPHAKNFRRVRDYVQHKPTLNLTMRLLQTITKDPSLIRICSGNILGLV